MANRIWTAIPWLQVGDRCPNWLFDQVDFYGLWSVPILLLILKLFFQCWKIESWRYAHIFLNCFAKRNKTSVRINSYIEINHLKFHYVNAVTITNSQYVSPPDECAIMKQAYQDVFFSLQTLSYLMWSCLLMWLSKGCNIFRISFYKNWPSSFVVMRHFVMKWRGKWDTHWWNEGANHTFKSVVNFPENSTVPMKIPWKSFEILLFLKKRCTLSHRVKWPSSEISFGGCSLFMIKLPQKVYYLWICKYFWHY